MVLTIDRIQVEFTTNVGEFIRSLDRMDQRMNGMTKSFTTVETSSVHFVSAMEDTGSATADAVVQMNAYTDAARTVADAAISSGTELKKQAENTFTLFDSFTATFQAFKKLMGVFGVSLGLNSMIGQLKELATQANLAGKAYGKMYSTIYYTLGELTQSQQDMAKSFVLEGFDKDTVSEVIARLTNLFPSAETTVNATGQSYLSEIAEDILWMDKKGYGTASDLITQINPALKKWQIPVSEITSSLSYLAATYRDTNTEVSTLLSSLSNMDELGKTLGYTFRDMADFIGAANIAGNLDDISNLGSRFESQFTSRVSEIYTALLSADAETLQRTGLSAELSQSLLKSVSEARERDEVNARMGAQQIAEMMVTAQFRTANEEASHASSQAQASQIWADALDSNVNRITNRLADLSMSIQKGYDEVKTANRDVVSATGQTTASLVKFDKGLGTSDYAAQNRAAWEEELTKTPFAAIDPIIEKRTNEYIRAGAPALVGGTLARLDYTLDVKDYSGYIPVILSPIEQLIADTSEETIRAVTDSIYPLDDAPERNSFQKWMDTCVSQLQAIVSFFTGASSDTDESGMDESMSQMEEGIGIRSDLNLTDIGSVSAETIDELRPLIETTDMLGTSLETGYTHVQTLIQESTNYSQTAYDFVIPAVEDETAAANNLAAAWWEAYRAKLAYSGS